jgi:hypothetical protein
MLVAVDIEAIGRQHTGVFCVAFAADFPSGVETKVFYFKTTDSSPSTLTWWTSDKDRALFLEKAMKKAGRDRNDSIVEMREYVQDLYERTKAIDKEIVWVSDFPEFDIGLVSAMFSEVKLLPLYLEHDNSPPADCVNYNTYLRGKAGVPCTESSKETYKRMKMTRPERAKDHDAEEDIKVILKEAKMALHVDETKV